MNSSVGERNCLRFYQGTVESYEINTEQEQIKYTSSSYTTRKAYELLNMLLYPGINNEYTRICSEKRKIPYFLLRNMEEVLYVYENIFSLMCKNTGIHRQDEFYLYRKDRMQSMEMVDAGCTFGFTSCSLEDDADEYFMRKKDGILLLEFVVPDGIPYVDVNEVLRENRFSSQKEILLPPFVRFQKKSCPFTEKELAYKDMNHESPKAKYLLKVVDMYLNKEAGSREAIFAGAAMAENVLRNMEKGKTLSQQEQEDYCEWKTNLCRCVRKRFAEIYWESRG